MDDMVLKGDEAYADKFKPSPARALDPGTFERPIHRIGMRRCAILGQEEPISAAVEAMRLAKIGSVLVTGPGGKLVGIFTERDALNRLALGEVDPARTPLKAMMHARPDTLTPDDPIGYALRLMSHGGYRRVPLVDSEGRPVGIISVRDIVDFIADLFPDDILTLPPSPRSNIAEKPEGA